MKEAVSYLTIVFDLLIPCNFVERFEIPSLFDSILTVGLILCNPSVLHLWSFRRNWAFVKVEIKLLLHSGRFCKAACFSHLCTVLVGNVVYVIEFEFGTMVRFFCFNSRIPRHRPKESVEGLSERVIREDGSNSKGLSSSIGESSKLADDSTAAIERIWKSEEIKPPQETGKHHHVCHLKKSQSHGDELYLDGRDATENGTDDGTDRVGSPNSLEQRETLAAGMSSTKRLERSPNVYQKDPPGSVSACQGSDQALYGSIFSVGDLRNDDISLYGEQMENSNSQTPYGSPVLVRSNSMPNIADSASGKSSPLKYSSRSSDDLCALGRRQRDNKPVHETDAKAKRNQDYDDDANGYSSMAKDWIVPATDELNSTEFIKGETSKQHAGYPGKDSRFKRIDDWVNDLQHTLEECRKMIIQVDGDGDGRVNYKEFRQMMKKGQILAQ
ncbi:hypothetical protein DY000_02010932 [Brassica cretica]|uniref:EF-hand domain-containing protein n=1 Tax=Brassica cretica TaxID=69181 RepID=A0ABQ7D4K8_BRACR|nr:hypothetical protein DY000_02010932 [Brassica cretica]